MVKPFGDIRLQGETPVRRRRTPRHSFVAEAYPFTLQPLGIAPVLAGDSLNFASLQFRSLTTGIKNRLAGWWCETWLFYVPISCIGDILNSDDLVMVAAVTDPTQPLSGRNRAAADWLHHRAAGRPSFMSLCLFPIVHNHFREENEADSSTTTPRYTNGAPAIGVVGSGWWDSAHNASDVEIPAITDPTAWDDRWTVYQNLRAARLTTASYEEWLAMQGVQVPPQLRGGFLVKDQVDKTLRIPELLYYTKDFMHPQLTTDPASGSVVANIQWTHSSNFKRRRRFAEPGFIVLCAAWRPKVFLNQYRTSAVDYLMHKAESWMPQEYETDPHMRLERFTGSTVAGADTGPIDGWAANYWIDKADVFLRGDQFCAVPAARLANGDTLAGAYNIVAFDNQLGGTPATGGIWKYASEASINSLFTGPAAVTIDGLLTLGIQSRISSDATRRV